jgi:hypothetical protein
MNMQNRSDSWSIEQYNRNRPPSEHISSVDQISNAYSQSWLTIRQEDGTDDWSAPIMWLDDESEYDLFISNDLNIDWVEEMDKEGSPIIKDDHLGRDICIEVTCPSKGWNKRRAVGYNIDFDWN